MYQLKVFLIEFQAVKTVDPKLAVGKLHTLWIEFGKFYETNDQLDDARLIFDKATQVPYTKGKTYLSCSFFLPNKIIFHVRNYRSAILT